MQPSTVLLTATLAATGLAAPAPESVSMKAAIPDWTIESLVRTCNAADTACEWKFGINTHLATVTPCAFTVKAAAGKKASQTDTAGNACGAFTVSAGWSGQFVEGFTTLSVVDYAARLITWPAYTDGQLANGKAVVPDKSWPVSKLQ